MNVIKPDESVKVYNSNTYGNQTDNVSKSSIQFLDLVDVISKKLPHTNAASRVARGDVFAMQVALGPPSVFFTLTPMDDNSLIISVYSGQNNKPKDYNHMSEKELKESGKTRSKLRIKYPGLCAYNFEICLKIIIQVIVGCYTKKQSATQKGGIFGIP